MTLHDRIMRQMPDDLTNETDEFYDGFAESSLKAAKIATEAGELMGSLAAALGQCQDALDANGRTDEVEYAQAVLDEYRRWTDRA